MSNIQWRCSVNWGRGYDEESGGSGGDGDGGNKVKKWFFFKYE